MNKTYENYGNKSHQTTANNAQLATIIHLKINRDMLCSISNEIVIFDFHVISNEPDGPDQDVEALWSPDFLINIPCIAVKMP